MKLVIDERLKHRLVGLSVVLSLGAIFLPALMKKSNQRLESNFSVKVKLPPKPAAPNVVMTNEKDMFKTIKVAKIQTPPEVKQQSSDVGKGDFIQSVPVAPTVAKVEPTSDISAVAKPIELALSNAAKNVVKKQLAEKKPARPVTESKVKVIKKQSVAKEIDTAPLSNINKKNVYAVQLASFAQLSNAQALVNKLQSQGHTANYVKTVSKRGIIYKVFTGHSPIKEDVVKLRSQLASAMQLKGFVVNTGVS